jgi:SWI/SNF-related matrix-associated actin-dependent regulator of chromatin subfamily A-like protein 1
MLTLRPYQQTDYDELLARFNRGDTAAICEWEPGLGKTVLSIKLHQTIGLSKLLVICPAIALVSWRIELEKWWPEAKVMFIDAGAKVKRLAKAEPDVVVVTMDLCRNDDVRVALRDWVDGGFAVVDEAQYLRGPATKRTASTYGKGEGVLTKAAKVLLLSGTLVVSWADDLWTHLARWMPDRITVNGQRLPYEEFRERFFVTRKVPLPGGYGHRIAISRLRPERAEELRFRLAKLSVVRKKTEANLPPLTWHGLRLELEAKDRAKIDSELMDHLPERLQRMMAQVQREPDNEELRLRLDEQIEQHSSLWAVMMRILGAGKAQAVARIVADEMTNSPQHQAVGLFALNHNVMDILGAALKAHGVLRIDGTTSPKERERIVETFQNPTGPRVFIGQIQACGTALTLTRANRCYMVQMSAVPGENFQAVSRFHRIGQVNPVDAFVPYVAGTIDQALAGIIKAKQQAQAALT